MKDCTRRCVPGADSVADLAEVHVEQIWSQQRRKKTTFVSLNDIEAARTFLPTLTSWDWETGVESVADDPDLEKSGRRARGSRLQSEALT